MEDHLLQIVQEASGARFANLKDSAQIAHDKMVNQSIRAASPSYELRSYCFATFKLALDTKKQKFISLALNGVHRMMRDDRFFLTPEPEDDSAWFPAQLLKATADMPITGNEENIVNMLRLFLAMACTPACTLNGRLLIDILTRCGECWEKGSRAVRAASLAASSQCLRAFSTFLKEESEELYRASPIGTMSKGHAAAVYNEVIPIIQWLIARINEINTGSPSKSEPPAFQFLLECILTLIASLPKESQFNPHFTAFLWQKFCPNLAAVLGFPSRINLDKKITYKDAMHLLESENRGFYIQKNVSETNARCIYLTAIELIRIAGFQASLRPMLEALFHRMLLLPATQNRAEPLKYVKEAAFKNPERLIDLSVILNGEKAPIGGDDMALFRLIIDSMQECALAAKTDCTKHHVLQTSVECIVALLGSLQTLIADENTVKIEADVVKAVNSRYATLKEADYRGPLTYQTAVRLPAPYREAVAELRKGSIDGASASESEPDVENVSIDSGDTEGPEEEPRFSSDNESNRNSDKWNFSNSSLWPDGDFDRHHARDFAKIIADDLVPKLATLRNALEVDEYLQEFASNVCQQQNTSTFSDFDYNLTAINADGIYLTTYSALLLGLQLTQAGHYNEPEKPIQIPLSEQQFVISVQNSGIFVCLSSAWLRELYQCILIANPLIHLSRNKISHCALLDVLFDAGGFGQEHMLTDWLKLHCVIRVKKDETEQQLAARKLARRLITCCWDSMVEILSIGLSVTKEPRSGKLIKLTKKSLTQEKTYPVNRKALVVSSLDGLRAAASLSNALNLQHLSGKILQLIANTACDFTGPRIPISTAMSMNVVLNWALDFGQNPECWLPCFNICRHITKLEHALFSSSQNNNYGSTLTNVVPTAGGKKVDTNENGGSMDDLKLKMSSFIGDDDEMAVDVYSFLQAPLQNPASDFETIIKSYQDSSEIVILSETDTAKVLCALSLQADSLFVEAAEKLALPSLCQFLKSLCRASREQLNGSLVSKKDKNASWWDFTNWKQKLDKSPPFLLLHRVADVTLKLFRGTRPLLHILKVWAVNGPHLMDAACHKDRTISKKAIESIHDVIVAVLGEQSELPYFHFNEALLKPFENLLNMETCDVDVADQIIACLMSLVESYRVEIRSAWRPLFGALRAARSRPVHLANIIDIFRVFLDSDNTLVFSYAGLDCILCLLSYLEISTVSTTTDIEDGLKNKNLDLIYNVLKYLERCANILDFMWTITKCPNLLAAIKLSSINYTHLVDSKVMNSIESFNYFGNDYFESAEDQYLISYKSLYISEDQIQQLDELDRASGVLKVWFLLLDGLTNALIVSPPAHQVLILQTIFKLFKTLRSSPGLPFALYCVNHLLIPTIQDWLRYMNRQKRPWGSGIEKNFKHFVGITTDLMVEFLESKEEGSIKSNEEGNGMSSRYTGSAKLALKQLLLVLIECAAQPQETVARVGVSCLKHIIFSIGSSFLEDEWIVVCSAIHRVSTVTLAAIKQLLLAFKRKSNSFYGDCATVKVVARSDTTVDELLRLKSLSEQVFLLDTQRDQITKKDISILDDRSYSFLLYSSREPAFQTLENYDVRLSYRGIVVGLLANQMILQLIANILLSDLKNVPAELHSCIYDHYVAKEKPRFAIDHRPREILLRCLRQHLHVSLEFDSRPGLKFLMQRIGAFEQAPNLYKQLTSSFICLFMALVDAYLSDIKTYALSEDDVRFVLNTCSKQNASVVKKKEYFVKYLFLLKEYWHTISELYLALVHVSLKPPDYGLENGEEAVEEGIGGQGSKEEVPPEIETQRITSMSKDAAIKRTVLAQLVIASTELLRLLPETAAESLGLLLTPTIKESFRVVESQKI